MAAVRLHRQAPSRQWQASRVSHGSWQWQRASIGQAGRARYRHGGHLFLSGAAVSSAANPPCYVFTNNGQAKDQQHLISDQTRRACVHVCTFGMALSLRQMMPRQAPSSGFFSQDNTCSSRQFFYCLPNACPVSAEQGTFLAKLRVRPDRSCNRIEH